MKVQKEQPYLKELRVTSADVECALCSHERHNQGDHDQSAVQEHEVIIYSSHDHSQRSDFLCQSNFLPKVST